MNVIIYLFNFQEVIYFYYELFLILIHRYCFTRNVEKVKHDVKHRMD